MDAELKAKWVTALRSGNYKQGLNTLRADDGEGGAQYCCLGVLCDIVPHITWEEDGGGDWWAIDQSSQARGDDSREFTYLPKTMDGIVPRDVQFELAGKNDKGRTFDEIANIIEKEL